MFHRLGINKAFIVIVNHGFVASFELDKAFVDLVCVTNGSKKHSAYKNDRFHIFPHEIR